MRTLAAVDQDFNLLTCVIRRLKNLEGFIIKGFFFCWVTHDSDGGWEEKHAKRIYLITWNFEAYVASPHDEENQNLKFSCYFFGILPYYEAIVCNVQFSGPGRLKWKKNGDYERLPLPMLFWRRNVMEFITISWEKYKYPITHFLSVSNLW